MSPHQQRVVEFIEANRIYSLLPDAEQSRMIRQRSAMTEYSEILGERIASF